MAQPARSGTARKDAPGWQPKSRAAGPGWKVMTDIAVSNTFLTDVVALRDGQAWASGASATQLPKPVFAHYLSGTWSTAPQPSDSLGQITVTGLSLIAGGQSVVAVGTALAGSGSNGTAIFKYGT
jgi:hypothetical protein